MRTRCCNPECGKSAVQRIAGQPVCIDTMGDCEQHARTIVATRQTGAVPGTARFRNIVRREKVQRRRERMNANPRCKVLPE